MVVGAGPNGLAAAITLAQAGRSVLVLEAEATPGGGARSAELTLPGFVHDVCSTIHPLGVSSPFFKSLPLEQHGLEWIYPPAALAHPFDDGTVALLERSFDATARGARARWRRLGPAVRTVRARMGVMLIGTLLAPFRPPRHPLLLARFGLPAHPLRARASADDALQGQRARALFAGMAAHSMLPLDGRCHRRRSASCWACSATPSAGRSRKGGRSRSRTRWSPTCALWAARSHAIRRVASIDELPPRARVPLRRDAPAAAADCAGPTARRLPAQLDAIATARASSSWTGRSMDRSPWTAPSARAPPRCISAGTLRRSRPPSAEVAARRASGEALRAARPAELVRPDRAPAGQHTAWAYCHVPNGSTVDMTDASRRRSSASRPAFASASWRATPCRPAAMEAHNANYIGGDINGGVQDLRQFFTRPVPVSNRTHAARGIYICSSSTPPGGGVHGMCGYWAARSALRRDN